MHRQWVLDASPIILLSKAGHADLLVSLSDGLVIPDAVAAEVTAGSKGSPAQQWLREHEQQFEQPAVSVSDVVAAWDLGAGESAVVSWAYRDMKWTAVIDDLAARRCARALDVRRTGTLGVALLAKEEGLIPAVAPILEKLIGAGLRASEALRNEVLRLAGE